MTIIYYIGIVALSIYALYVVLTSIFTLFTIVTQAEGGEKVVGFFAFFVSLAINILVILLGYAALHWLCGDAI